MNARLRALALPAIALLALAAGPATATADESLCEPSPAAAPLVDRFEGPYDFFELSADEWQRTVDEVEAALAEHPDDLFLHRLREDLFRFARKDVKEERLPKVREEYARLAQEHPGDARFLYLAGRIAEDFDKEEEANRAALEADPDFPWTQFGMTLVTLRQPEPDKAAAERYLARFADLCPGRVYEILVVSGSVGSKEFWHDRIPDLHRRIAEDPAKNARAFPALWALQFRQADVSEHAAVREHVARDVETLAALDPKSRSVLAALKEGYELSGQAEAAAAMEAEMRAASPCAPESVYSTLDAWNQEHPQPDSPDKEAWAVWSRAMAEAAQGWIERCPNEYHFWNQRLHALAAIDDADPAEVQRVGERTAELYGTWPGSASPSGYDQVAKVFADKGIALDRALELLEQGAEDTRKRREGRDLSRLPEKLQQDLLHSNLVFDWTHDALEAEVRIARGDLEPAAKRLDELADRLGDLAPGEDESGRAVVAQSGRESELWKLRADLAEAAGRLPDALAYLIEAEATRPEDAPPWVQGLRPSQADERIPDLWARIGGGEEALAALRASRAAAQETTELADASPWVDAEGMLPAFELKDLSGRVWKPADLAGKTVFANAWATWCGPCREELPAVQALHDELAGRDDVVVLTFNMDENTGAVAPFLTKEELEFPVLLAIDYLRDDLEVYAIPRSWIVDGTGALRREQSGYDPSVSTDEWVAQVVGEMDSVAATANGPGGR